MKQLPIGTFESSPIVDSTRRQAQERLSHTYKPERWLLKPTGKRISMWGGKATAWTFYVIPKRAA